MTDTYVISSQPKDKSFVGNTEVDLIASNSDTDKNYVYTQALIYRHCNSAAIAELEPGYGLTITIYEFDPYVRNQKVKHRHIADTSTRVNVLECIAAEKRLLEDIDPNDHVYFNKANRE
jgi:hypothetical protein